MKVSHEGMRIVLNDWEIFFGHLKATREEFYVSAPELADVLSFIGNTKNNIIEE